MNESVIYLPEVDSTNLWAKHNLDKFGPIGAVYTTHQTAGRGRLGRSWLDAPHKGLYYTAVIRTDLVQPATLPLFASLAVCDALRERYDLAAALRNREYKSYTDALDDYNDAQQRACYTAQYYGAEQYERETVTLPYGRLFQFHFSSPFIKNR